MDWENLLNLVFFAFSMNGVARIYTGKTAEKKSEVVKGIAELCISVFGVAITSPIFEYSILSFLVAAGFSFFVVAYMAGVFVNTKPPEEILHVNAELLPPGETEAEKAANSSSFPMSLGNIKSVVEYVRKK